MKYASFSRLEDIELFKKVGFDGVELDCCQLRKLSDDDFKLLGERLRGDRMEVCACSWIMENSIHICDAKFDTEGWIRRFDRDAARLAELGCKVMVFAAGPIRTVGADKETEKKKDIINSFIFRTAQIFGNHGVELALETVCYDYTDYLTALYQSAELCEKVSNGNLYMLTDIRHLVRAGDEPDDILRYRDKIIHAHIDNPIHCARRMPLPDDGYDYDFFIRRIMKTKTEWISFECHDETRWLTRGAESLAYIRSVCEKYTS